MIETQIKVVILLSVAALVNLGLRRSAAAAVRHWIWTLALLSAIFLFLLPAPSPRAIAYMEIDVLPDSRPVEAVVPVREPSQVDWLRVAWIAGIALVGLRYAAGAWRVSRTERLAEPFHTPEFDEALDLAGVRRGVVLRRSKHAIVPFTWGVIRPSITLPAESSSWDAARMRVVLLHEVIHIRRMDWLADLAGQMACALFWFNPLVWFAAAQARRERELACDDGVLRLGESPAAYAGHLLDLAQSLSGNSPDGAAHVAMWQKAKLEDRMKSLFDSKLSHRELTRSLAAVASTVAIAAVIGLSGVRLQAQYNSTLRGVVHDPSGARVPKANIIAVSTENKDQQQKIQADEAGEYKLFLAPGNYSITIEAPGFARVRRVLLVEAGQDRLLDLTVPLGQIREELTITGKVDPSKAAATPSEPKRPERVRVGGNVQASNLVDKVVPVYPLGAKDDRIQGTVSLRAVISKDGKVIDLQPTGPSADYRLVQAAIDAVRQWRYTPTLLNGEPVEVITQIDINFTLAP